jgi:hypothetical protein
VQGFEGAGVPAAVQQKDGGEDANKRRQQKSSSHLFISCWLPTSRQIGFGAMWLGLEAWKHEYNNPYGVLDSPYSQPASVQ